MKNNKILYSGFHSIEKIEPVIKGEKRIIERIRMNDAVAAIMTDADGKIGLVRQYRPCVEEITYELPAGMMDKPGKTAKEVLMEELEEECEISRQNVDYFSEYPLHTYYMLCGSTNAVISIYRIRLSSKEQSKLVKDSDVESVEWFTLHQFENLVQQDGIKDAKTLMAYLFLKNE